MDTKNIKSMETIKEEVIDEKPQISLFQRILKVFTNPIEVMEDIAIKPKALLPVLIIIAIFGLTFALKFDLYKVFIVDQFYSKMAKTGNEVLLDDSMINIMVWAGIGGVLIWPILGLLIKSLVTHGIARIFDSKGKFKTTFAAITFAYLINIFGEIIRTIIALITKTYLVTTSPALFLSDSAINTPLFTALSSLDVFSIWYLVVSIIGISIVHKISKGKAAVAVLVPWGVMVGMSIVSAMFNG